MRLFVVKDYRCREVHYEPGQILEVSPAEGAHLLVDAPGCFSLQEPKKSFDRPPADKMVRGSKRK